MKGDVHKMANYKKFTKQQLGKMLSHYDRTDENPKENIDRNRTHLNYNLAPKADKKQIDILNQRLSEVKVQNRKDVNLLCSWVITMPKTLPENREEEFFRQSYLFLEDRYGKENVVSAFIHKDEATPHMHFAFIPVVKDQKKNRLKVSAKECVTLLDLQKFHGELQEHLERSLGCQVDILNEATKEGNKSIAELKRESATEQLSKAKARARELVAGGEKYAQAAEDAIKPIKAEYEAKEVLLKALKTEPSMRGIKLEKPFIGDDYYKVELERMYELLTKEKLYPEIKKVNEKLIQELEEIKNNFTYQQFRTAINQYHEMKQELTKEQRKTQQLLQHLKKYKDRYGELEEPQQSKVLQRHRSRKRSNDGWERG